jgi:DNA-binding PadR family transcriptional regulator
MGSAEFLVLGLLHFRDLTVTDAKLAFDRLGEHCGCSVPSFVGSLLDQLVDSELARFEEISDGSSERSIYSVTDRGRQEFEAWLRAPVEVVAGSAELRARLYFLGLLPEAERRDIADSMVFDLLQARDDLQALLDRRRQEGESRVLPGRWSAVPRHEQLAIEAGMLQCELLAKWLQQQLVTGT